MASIPRWHFAMLNDETRNQAFEQAIQLTVDPGDRVVDIGAGTGFLSLLAVRHGAVRSDAFEAQAEVARTATEVIARHGGQDSITVHPCLSHEVVLAPDRRGDVLITEIFDCALVGEGILPSLRAARSGLLKPGYRAIPRRAVLWAGLLECPDARRLNQVEKACAIDVSAFNEHSTRGQFPLRLTTWQHRMLSEPEQLYAIDFESEPSEESAWLQDFTVTRGGVVDGVVGWFDLDLAEGITLSTHPSRRSHWMQAYLGFEAPVEAEAGAILTVSFALEDDTRLVAQPTGATTPGPRAAGRPDLLTTTRAN
jgi:predicted RNA methylase